MPSVFAVAALNGLTYWRLRSKTKRRRDDVGCRRPQPTTPLAANQRADCVAQPGAIIPPVLELPQATCAAEQPPLAVETLAGLLQE